MVETHRRTAKGGTDVVMMIVHGAIPCPSDLGRTSRDIDWVAILCEASGIA